MYVCSTGVDESIGASHEKHQAANKSVPKRPESQSQTSGEKELLMNILSFKDAETLNYWPREKNTTSSP